LSASLRFWLASVWCWEEIAWVQDHSCGRVYLLFYGGKTLDWLNCYEKHQCLIVDEFW